MAWILCYSPGGGGHISTGLPAQEALGDDFPMWIVYVSQNLTFGGGLLGITYGIMSTSWDPSREGTVSQCAPQGEGQSIPVFFARVVVPIMLMGSHAGGNRGIVVFRHLMSSFPASTEWFHALPSSHSGLGGTSSASTSRWL